MLAGAPSMPIGLSGRCAKVRAKFFLSALEVKYVDMIVSAALSFGITFICLLVLVSAPVRQWALDQPNERSLHALPVPRTGGLAILAGASISIPYLSALELAILILVFFLALVSFLDDLIRLPSLLRLVAHLVAGCFMLYFLVPRPEILVFVALLLCIGWVTNLFNFMDGADGLAGGMAVVGFGAYAIAAYAHGSTGLSVFNLVLSMSAIAFLLFNFHPARIFMGDVGSVPLGFAAAALGIAGWQVGAWTLWYPLLVFSPFIIDATLTLLDRLLRKEKVWIAHRDHYYQRLVRMGFGHRNTALAEYLLMMVCAAIALCVRNSSIEVQVGSLAAAAVAYTAIAVWINIKWERHAAQNAA
jgi:UDP-GlcNAc:undecaprenyl-phosphate/decaprenyl-phosphate GlcNAc-1-phosphate transferase